MQECLLVEIDSSDLGPRNTKWTNRVARALDKAGKVYDTQTIEDVKVAASKIAERNPGQAFDDNWSEILLRAKERIEQILLKTD